MNIKFIYFLSILIGIFAVISNVNAKYEDVPSSIQKKFLPYIDCALDRKPCDFVGSQIKNALPDWFKNECANCNFLIKSEAKKRIPDVKKYFPEDWQLIEQKYGSESTVQKVQPTFSAPSKPSIRNEEQKARPTFSVPSKPMDQEYQLQKVQSVSDKSASVEDLFANDQSFGAKAVLCLVMRKGCDKRMKMFKNSLFLFTTINTCAGCQNPKVHRYFTQAKNLLEKSFPEVLKDIIDNRGE